MNLVQTACNAEQQLSMKMKWKYHWEKKKKISQRCDKHNLKKVNKLQVYRSENSPMTGATRSLTVEKEQKCESTT